MFKLKCNSIIFMEPGYLLRYSDWSVGCKIGGLIQQGQEIFYFSIVYILTLGPSPPSL